MHTSSTLTLMSSQCLASYITWAYEVLVINSLKFIGLLIACNSYYRSFCIYLLEKTE